MRRNALVGVSEVAHEGVARLAELEARDALACHYRRVRARLAMRGFHWADIPNAARGRG